MSSVVRTETVAVAFTDLVKSTEFASRVGHDAYEVLRREHFKALRTVVAAHAGTEVKSTGDGLMLAFDSAADAVDCCVAMQQAVERAARRSADAPLQMRVGLSIGEATRDGGDLYGPPVVEAARLCAAADGGQVVISDLVRQIVRGRATHTFTAIGPLPLPGLPEPVPACTVQWEPAPETPAAGLPLPPLLARSEQFRFAGRDAELATLQRNWEEAAAGARRVVLVAGEPGIGKTRLAAETARSAHARGATVLCGHCDEDLGVPFQPFVEALRYYVEHSAARDRGGGAPPLGRHPGDLIRLLPELGGLVPDLPPPLQSDAETERYRMFEAVASWLAAAAVEQPVLLVLDDLHWAAKPTLLLLRHVLRSTELERLLIVINYRHSDVSRRHPLVEMLADLRPTEPLERITLRGLAEADVRSLVEQTAGHALDDDGLAIVRAVHTETEGNPFFIGELIRHLAETGAVFRREVRWIAAGGLAGLGIPESVKEVIGRRLNRLSETTNRALSVAAVIGREFDFAVLWAVSELEEGALFDALDEALLARLIEKTPAMDSYRFAHALVQETLYGEVNDSRRVRMHGRIAEAIAVRRPDDLTALAYHYGRAADAADVAKAVAYARRAGDAALAQLAYEDAVQLYQAGLAALARTPRSDEAARADLLLQLGTAQRKASEPELAEETLKQAAELARRLGDPELLARIGLVLGGVEDKPDAIDAFLLALLEEALAGLPPQDSPLRAQLLGRLAIELYHTTSLERRELLSRQALEMARRIGDPAIIVHALYARHFAILGPDHLDERLQIAAELVRLSEEIRHAEGSLVGHMWMIIDHLELGDMAGVERETEQHTRRAEELRQSFFLGYSTMWRALRVILDGRFDDGEALQQQALAVGRGLPRIVLHVSAQMLWLRDLQGRCAEILPIVQAMRLRYGTPLWTAITAYVALHAGDDGLARQLFDELADSDFPLHRDGGWLNGMVWLAEAAAGLADAPRAGVLYERLLPYADRNAFGGVAAICPGPVAHYLGLLATTMGRWDDADAHFSAALAIAERMRARPLSARTEQAFAAMLCARGGPGDATRARTLAGRALESAEALGMAQVAEWARAIRASLAG